MPHFVIDCAQSILIHQTEDQIIERVFHVANETGLFEENDIKIRVNPFAVYSVGNKREEFIHVFGHIMEGRSVEQRHQLSRNIVNELVSMFPQVAYVAINIAEFEKATYFNRAML
jgi:5-carboxymethyl-2-hydroxymuconate isomerase